MELDFRKKKSFPMNQKTHQIKSVFFWSQGTTKPVRWAFQALVPHSSEKSGRSAAAV